MEDREIIELFFLRSEDAVAGISEKYGKYCHYIASRILPSPQDCEECVNDAFLRVWNAIPPNHPGNLCAFLGTVTRNLALDRYQAARRQKRGSGLPDLPLDELEHCLPASGDPEQLLSSRELAGYLNAFLAGLPPLRRKIFVRRYWYLSSIREIAEDLSLGESNVKVTLHRLRKELKQYLEKEGAL